MSSPVRAMIGWRNYLLTKQTWWLWLGRYTERRQERWCRPLLTHQGWPYWGREGGRFRDWDRQRAFGATSVNRWTKEEKDVWSMQGLGPWAGQMTLLMALLFIPQPALAWHKSPPQCTPILSESSFPTSLNNVFLDDFVCLQLQKLMRKVKSTVQQNAETNERAKKSTILVFYYHPQNEKKKENQPMADEEIPEESSNSSAHDSPGTSQCPPGARDLE